MSIPEDKDFDLAVEKAIDEIFGSTKKTVDFEEDDSLKIPLELEPMGEIPLEDTSSQATSEERKEPSKVIEFPTLDDLLEPSLSEETSLELESSSTSAITQEDLEKLSASLLSLEWEVSPENCFEFLTLLEEIKEKADPQTHELFDLIYEVGKWLKDRAYEAQPAWLHFLHQGIVALNLIALHGKEPQTYIAHLKKVFEKLSSKPEVELDKKIAKKLIKDLTLAYQRFIMFQWLFKHVKWSLWQNISQKALKDIETIILEIPEKLRPNLKLLARATLEHLERSKKSLLSGLLIKTPQKDRFIPPPFKRAYLCESGLQNFLIPEEEVAFKGPVEEKWRLELQKGHFPLKNLLGPWGFLPFIRLKNKLVGELTLKEESFLRSLSLEVSEEYREGDILLILWKDEKGLVILVDQAKLIPIKEKARFIKSSRYPCGLLLINEKKYPVFSITGYNNED